MPIAVNPFLTIAAVAERYREAGKLEEHNCRIELDDTPVPIAADEESMTQVLDNLLGRYVESLVYQAVVENGACEQSARMVAMKSASDNAKSLIDELQLIYNKARQAAITQEISEIVGGAAAV